ncbi:hypothetical protein NHH03_23195 [Stieleria sp. TO1_6]|uniref:hypothetical protein n=1 Tax=Stieleria tagensis TaxID=2956795 RepID=UPI00209A85DF|nr:hypothetical protein [Stieleria tagensis]MCO8124664.1 hypothetical protein [Stieleria tagensis]
MSESNNSESKEELILSVDTLDQWETDVDRFSADIRRRLARISEGTRSATSQKPNDPDQLSNS